MKIIVLKPKKIIIVSMLFLLLIFIIFMGPSILRFMYPLQFEEYVGKYSKQFSLDKYLVYAIMKTESNFKPEALSHKEAIGLMQITGDTAKWVAKKMNLNDYNKEKLLEPEFNIMLGCWYLSYLMQQFDSKVELVTAAYNAGDGNVRRWQKEGLIGWKDKKIVTLPFSETQEYVRKVRAHYFIYKTLYHKNEK